MKKAFEKKTEQLVCSNVREGAGEKKHVRRTGGYRCLWHYKNVINGS